LGIALTQRGTLNGEPIPLCGVPLHVVDHYLHKLVRAGFKVALCDQLEIPKPGKVVDRGVTQVLTPGTLTDSKLLDEKTPSYLAVFSPTDPWTGLFVELLTGQLFITQFSDRSFQSIDAELVRFMPDEIILSAAPASEPFQSHFQRQGYVVSQETSSSQDESKAHEWFSRAFPELSFFESFKDGLTLLYTYLTRNNEEALRQIKHCVSYKAEEYLMLDAATQRNLELVKNAQDGGVENSLFSLLDHAITSMGSRMLKKWILRPLLKKEPLEERLDAVEGLVADYEFRTKIRDLLKSVGDIERIVGRIALKRAQIHDYTALAHALTHVPLIKSVLKAKSAKIYSSLESKITDFSALESLLHGAFNQDRSKEWLIKEGYSEELDRLRKLADDGTASIMALEASEQKKTGISSLKIRYNQVHGYAIEVTTPNLSAVPAHYLRTQTLSNRERFTMQELKDLEYDMSRARSQIVTVEKELFETVKESVEQYVSALRKMAYALAYLDGIAALAHCAVQNNYVRPHFVDHEKLSIVDGRHPVVDARLRGTFIPNSVHLDESTSVWIITGPNMGGKSTFLRQVALICLLAQIGSFVPAARAELPLIDRIFTRIGAADNVAQGKSTFLVEMEETALICKNATRRSLVILDEVGRGTSTFDGLALAQAVVEYLYTAVHPYCLFATHYHELTALSDTYPGVRAYYAASMKTEQGVVLLHKIKEGVADGSFGLDVAVLAGLPDKIILRAREIVGQLNVSRPVETAAHAQLDRIAELERVVNEARNEKGSFIAARLSELDCEQLTPKQALDLIYALKDSLK
jgi:DNA mismatch repair protein MutS